MPSAQCPFAQTRVHAFVEAGWLLLGLVTALVWLSLFVLTGIRPLTVSLGLLVVLPVMARR